MRKRSRYNITECRDIKKQNKENGSITIEAVIFLTLFILFYMALMDLVQIAKAQIVLQYSINEVAKEISSYSYVLTKTGIVEKRLSTASQANEFIGKTEDMVDAVLNVGNTLVNNGDLVSAVGEAGTQIEGYFGDTDALVSNLLSLVKTAGADIVSDLIISELAKKEVEKQIEMLSGKSADKYLKDLGIEEGMDGLDFSKSNWCKTSSEGMPILEVAVVYEIRFHLGYFELAPRKFKLCAKTALW